MVTTPAILFANTLLLLGLAVAGWFHRSTPGARSFAALQFASAIWAALTILGLTLPQGPDRLRVWGLTVATSLVVVALWIAFIFEYTGRDHWLEPRRFVPAAAPLCIGASLYAIAPSWSPLVSETQQALMPAGTVVSATIGPIGGVLGIYLYGMFLVGLLVVARTALTEQRVFVGQGTALVLGTLVTVVASGARIAGVLPYPGYPLTQVALGPQSLLWGYAVFSRDLLGQVPAIARIGERTVFEDVEDGLLVTDEDGIVLRANAQVRDLFDAPSVVGMGLETLLEDVDVDPESTEPQQCQHEGRTYHLRGSVMTDWHEEVIGRAYILRDVTELVRRQQRLEVLNRVLRHNLRNEVMVIRASAREVESRASEDIAELGTRITQHADRLATLGEKARELQNVFDASLPEDPFDIETVLEDAIEPLDEQYPDAVLSLSVEVTAIRVNRALLSLVVQEAVENALAHAGSDPVVEITVREHDSDIEITVEDDGPGIPSSELKPIQIGRETSLEHTSGLGMWLIHWGTRSLGGTVRIESNGNGTAVSVIVPSEPGEIEKSVTSSEAFDRERTSERSGSRPDTVGTD